MAAFPVPRRPLKLAVAVVLALGLLPVPGAAPATAAKEPPYRLNLGSSRDYVRQTNFVQCVGASVQMMLNIIEPGADRTRKTQRELQVTARTWSGPRPDGTARRGAGVTGWAAALVINRAGPYRIVGADTLQEAMQVAAAAIREYRRPVGLLVWQGRHAWVMSGFESTRDPVDGSFRVTRAYILDPLHPYGSKVWGPSPRPGSAISVAAVGRQFVPRRTGGSAWNRLPGMRRFAGKYVLVVPTGQVRPGID